MSEEHEVNNDLPQDNDAGAVQGATASIGAVDTELEQKCAEYERGWKRALADYENLKRDLAQRTEESRRRIRASFAGDLLPVVDNFAQAVRFKPDLSDLPAEQQKRIDPWLQGILYIEKQFEEVLRSLGVQQIATDGQFDPHLHEAAGTSHDETKGDGAIIEIVTPGWKIDDIVLRPAKVIINSLSEQTDSK